MADTIRRVDYRYAVISDKPGEGFRVAAALKEAGVSLLALLAFPAQKGKAQVDFVAESDDALVNAAKAQGLELSPRKRAFLIQGDDRRGALAEHLQRLANAKINVTATSALCAGNGRYGCILWVKSDSYDAAARALGA